MEEIHVQNDINPQCVKCPKLYDLSHVIAELTNEIDDLGTYYMDGSFEESSPGVVSVTVEEEGGERVIPIEEAHEEYKKMIAPDQLEELTARRDSVESEIEVRQIDCEGAKSAVIRNTGRIVKVIVCGSPVLDDTTSFETAQIVTIINSNVTESD